MGIISRFFKGNEQVHQDLKYEIGQLRSRIIDLEMQVAAINGTLFISSNGIKPFNRHSISMGDPNYYIPLRKALLLLVDYMGMKFIISKKKRTVKLEAK
jgi:hypothetical protein